MELKVSEEQAWALAAVVMTKDQHLAFWLRHHEDFTATDISRMLGISRQATDARIEGGRRRLLKAIKEAA